MSHLLGEGNGRCLTRLLIAVGCAGALRSPGLAECAAGTRREAPGWVKTPTPRSPLAREAASPGDRGDASALTGSSVRLSEEDDSGLGGEVDWPQPGDSRRRRRPGQK